MYPSTSADLENVLPTNFKTQESSAFTYTLSATGYATMKYHKTKDILHVMQRLGHRNIENTLIYTQLIQFESDQFHSAVAKTIDEARKLVEAGFEYICTYEDIMLFKKRK